MRLSKAFERDIESKVGKPPRACTASAMSMQVDEEEKLLRFFERSESVKACYPRQSNNNTKLNEKQQPNKTYDPY